MTKKCKYCGIFREDKSFQISGTIKGKTYRRLKCTFCKTKDQVKRKKIIRDSVREYKGSYGCKNCRIMDVRVLCFHHLFPKRKDLSVSDLMVRGFSLKRIMEEIKKCVVLCRNCHAIVHFENIGT